MSTTETVPFGNDPSKVARYRAFWDREPVRRPLVGFSYKSWFPLNEFGASERWQSSSHLTPNMVHPRDFIADQERLLREGEGIEDDIFRGASPSQAVPWLDGMMGCTLRILPGSILPEERTLSWEQLRSLSLDTAHPWVEKYIEFITVLVDSADGRYPVSHGTLHGPTDIVASLRGHSQSILDLVQEPSESVRLLTRAGDVFRAITEETWKHIPRFHGGYYDAQYQLWSPGPIVRMQEDATALYSPDLYRTFVQPIDRELARHFPSAFIHLHSTSMFILDAFLEIEEIRCFEVNIDVAGPSVEHMIPYFRMIQHADRPLLIRGSFTPEDMRRLLDRVDPAGLYLYIMVTEQREIEALRPLLMV